MRHQMLDCSKYAPGHSTEPIEDCDECRKLYESWSGICPHCWRPVTNSAYFGKRGKSIHLDGKCAEKFEGIPKAFLARRSLAARSVIVDYSAGNDAIIANNRAIEARKAPSKAVYLRDKKLAAQAAPAVVEPEPVKLDPLAERLAKLLEEQNELLKKLAA